MSTSYRLHTETRETVERLAKSLGVSQAEVIELAVRQFAQERAIEDLTQKMEQMDERLKRLENPNA